MRKNFVQFCLLIKNDALKRANFLRKHNILGSIGKNVWYRPYLIPSEPQNLFIGNNVKIAAGVRFVTHDIINETLNMMDERYHVSSKMYQGKIAIGNNVAIGSNAIILYNKKIGNNVIIAAGSVVTKNIPDNEVWGGNPASRICSFDEFVEKRKKW